MAGKSRADLWSLAAIVAVDWGVETNNMKCEDPASVAGECHHLQGEPGCQVLLKRTIPFRSGRAIQTVSEGRPSSRPKRSKRYWLGRWSGFSAKPEGDSRVASSNHEGGSQLRSNRIVVREEFRMEPPSCQARQDTSVAYRPQRVTSVAVTRFAF